MFNPDLTTIGNITGTYDPNTGVLQLTSDQATATQAALKRAGVRANLLPRMGAGPP